MANSKVPEPNHNYVPEFQMSSIPYVTCSFLDEALQNTPISISFPSVTRWICISNWDNTANLRVGFSENGVKVAPNKNYLVVPKLTVTPRLEVKCKEIFIAGDNSSGSFSVMAGLTNIQNSSFPTLTGSLQDANGNDLLPGIG